MLFDKIIHFLLMKIKFSHNSVINCIMIFPTYVILFYLRFDSFYLFLLSILFFYTLKSWTGLLVGTLLKFDLLVLK
jgi:hypothetical protein